MAENAHYWDETNESKMGKYVTQLELEFVRDRLQNFDKNIKILIVGCGSGKEAEYIHDFGFKDITGTDPDPDYLNIAKKKVPALKIKVDKAPKINFKDNTFDLVIGLEMMGYFKDHQKFISEVSRVLNESGHFVFQMTNKTSIKALAYYFYSKLNKGKMVPFAYAYSFLETKKMLKKAGLKIKSTKGFNWNVLYRASNSVMVDICAKFEKIGLGKMTSLSPWIMIDCEKV